MPVRILLKDILSQGVQGLKLVSEQLAIQNAYLSFRDVDSISDIEMGALFAHLPREWDYGDFDEVFDMESFNNEQLADHISSAISKWSQGEDIYASPNDHQDPPPLAEPSIPPSKNKVVGGSILNVRLVIALIAVTLVGGAIFKVQGFLSGYRFSQPTLLVGAVNSEEQYASLQKHLQKKLVPSSFWKYLAGEKVEVAIDAASAGKDNMPYPQAIAAFKDQRWDVGFSYSPVIAISAVDSGYTAVALMFPDSKFYQASIFVREDSPIQSFGDIDGNQTIALGDFFSASKFYLPVYELYGRRLRVIPNMLTREIFELVRSGKVDIGVGIIDNPESEEDLRIIKQSRNIPGAGVYLSPKLSPADSNSVKNALLSASEEIRSRENANYGVGDEPDFQHFRGIIQRVREVTACSDFTQNPVNFFCDDQTQVLTVQGRINGIERNGDDSLFRVFEYDGDICRLQVSSELLNQVQSHNTPFDFKDYYVNASVGVSEETRCEQNSIIKVFQPNQLELTTQAQRQLK